MSVLKNKNVLVGISGSIAAYKGADLVSKLVQEGAHVTVLMTPAALEFVRPLTFQALTGNPVYSDLFKEPPAQHLPTHTTLAGEADLILVAPASADVLAKFSLGLAPDVLTAAVLASNSPLLVAPAMNNAMYKNDVTQGHLRTLKRRGVHQVGPGKGFLACRYEGPGRMAEPDEILAAARRILARKRK